MNHQFKITIPQPCSENWNNMDAAQNGKFCQSCAKNVVDFTRLSDGELKSILLKDNDKICGRFLPEQLGRFIGNDGKQSSYIRSKVFLASLFTFLFVSKANATQKSSKINYEVFAKQKINKENFVNESDSILVIGGKVLDSQNELPLPGVNVLIKGTKIGAITDAKGGFKLVIPESLMLQRITVVYSYIGYLRKDIELQVYNFPKNIVIKLQADKAVLGGVEVVGLRIKPTFWQKLMRPFKKVVKACSKI